MIDELYHTKQQKGTKTRFQKLPKVSRLYHTKQQKGTKTALSRFVAPLLLYHTKQQKGTKTWEPFDKIFYQLYHTKQQKLPRELLRLFIKDAVFVLGCWHRILCQRATLRLRRQDLLPCIRTSPSYRF